MGKRQKGRERRAEMRRAERREERRKGLHGERHAAFRVAPPLSPSILPFSCLFLFPIAMLHLAPFYPTTDRASAPPAERAPFPRPPMRNLAPVVPPGKKDARK